jgi:glycosyltransferase involved in cell wall biosynthesis
MFAQTYENWELLLVDDGSTDESVSVALQYAQQYPGKIHYLDHPNHQNCGMSASRNRGISQATGKYISFLDADDAYFPAQLEQQVALLESHPEAAMVWGRTQVWFSWTGKIEDRDLDSYSHFGMAPNCLISPPMMLPNLLDSHERAIPCVCSVLVRRAIFEELSGFENQFRSKFEDSVFWIKVFSAKPIFISDHTWGRYRQHATNSCVIATQTGEWKRGNLSPARQAYLIWIAEYLAAIGFKDATILSTLDRELWGYRHQHLYQFLRHMRHSLSRAKRFIKHVVTVALPASL